VRVLIFHGYLLAGTGSNVYNARLAEALVRLGHEVHLLCRDRHPERQRFVDAVADWDAGELRLRELQGRQPRGRGRCTVYRPDIGGLLPVYVYDRYEGVQARSFLECSDAELAAYVDANVQAVREVVERARPDVALANHLVMGPAILARGLPDGVPYAVKVHGSALEYTVKRDPQRFLAYAQEGLKPAKAILVGSLHTATSLWEALGDSALRDRTRLGPPGVDVERFAPREPARAAVGLEELARRLRMQAADRRTAEPASTFARDEAAAADAVERLGRAGGPLVAFVGKLIAAKGIDLLLAAWPLVLQQVPSATLAVVGFGGWHEQVQKLRDTLARGELASAQADALPRLRAFLAGLREPERGRYRDAAAGLRERVVLTGRLDHEELADLLPACEALVVPSTFPEAFGMVAAEAAACGVLPVSARHSGLAEVSRALARALPEQAAGWLSFPVDDDAVRAIAARVLAWLEAEPELRDRARAGLADVARERWSWEGVANAVIAAARGDLQALEEPR
jgi:glycosyltransferase involved in cell wall biosynthesis